MTKNKKVQKKPTRFRGKRKINEETTSEFDGSKAPNDWQWYAQDEYLLRDTASFSYNYPLGNNINYGALAGQVANSTSIPGIMAIYCSQSIGTANNPMSPFNVAMREKWSFLSSKNSRYKEYDPIDLGIYCLAVASAYSYYSYLRRAYGVITTSSYANRYYPVAAIQAMDINFQDIQMNIADFRAYINVYAAKLNKLAVPADMPFMARWMWMYANIYTDTPNDDKAQTYMYVPETFLQYCLDDDGAGALVHVDFTTTTYQSQTVYPTSSFNFNQVCGHTLKQLVEFGDNLLAPLEGTSTSYLISGDIQKAYDPSQLYRVPGVPEDYAIVPVYSNEVLNQINNASLIGRKIDPTQPIRKLNPSIPESAQQSTDPDMIYQDSNKQYIINEEQAFIISTDTDLDADTTTWANSILSVISSNRIVNFDNGPITPADTMVATRLTNISSTTSLENPSTNPTTTHTFNPESKTVYGGKHYVDPNPNQPGNANFTAFQCFYDTVGSDRANFAKIFYFAFPNRGNINQWSVVSTEDIYTVMPSLIAINSTKLDSDNIASTMQTLGQLNADDFRRAAMISCFRRHPAVAQLVWYQFVHAGIEGTNSIPFNTYLNDINYYTSLNSDDLLLMTQTALLSEFGFHRIGSKTV